jgi:hypothetical protein
LQNQFSVSVIAADSPDDQNQSAEFVLNIFGLNQLQRIARFAKDWSLSKPLPTKKLSALMAER